MKQRLASLRRNNLSLALLGALVLATGGCSMIPTLQRKFIRKPKSRPPPAVSVTTKDYDSDLTLEDRYHRQYMMWQFWSEELLDGVSTSPKKALRATDESLAALQAMQRLLWDEKGQLLNPAIGRLEKLRHDLDRHLVTGQAIYRWRADLERQNREIHREFSWNNIGDYLMPPQTPPPPLPDAPSASEE